MNPMAMQAAGVAAPNPAAPSGATGSIGEILGSLQGVSPQGQLPQAPFPAQQSAMNPAFMQMIMQAMQAGHGVNAQAPTLGALLGGR